MKPTLNREGGHDKLPEYYTGLFHSQFEARNTIRNMLLIVSTVHVMNIYILYMYSLCIFLSLFLSFFSLSPFCTLSCNSSIALFICFPPLSNVEQHRMKSDEVHNGHCTLADGMDGEAGEKWIVFMDRVSISSY